MRICYIADGRYIHTRRWMRFFSARGHEMHLVSFAPMKSDHVQAIQEVGGIYHGGLGGFHVKRFWRTMRDLNWLIHLLRREKIDVLHCHFLGANAWYAALSRFRPLVITVMGGGDVCGPDWRPHGSLRERLLTPLALGAADLVTSWSHVMAEVVRPYCRKHTPVEVIHGGVDLQRFCSGPKPRHLQEQLDLPWDAKIIFSPRLMRPLSNIDQIAVAAGQVCEVYPNAYFLFAAPAEERKTAYEASVQEILQGSAAATKTRFIGAIPHDEMADYHRLADVTISIPSTDGTPMTVLESMACGTPLVVSDIPDYDQHYIESGKTVLTAQPDKPRSVADAVLRLLQEPALREELTTEARRRIEADGSYEVQMSRLEQLYKELFAAQPA